MELVAELVSQKFWKISLQAFFICLVASSPSSDLNALTFLLHSSIILQNSFSRTMVLCWQHLKFYSTSTLRALSSLSIASSSLMTFLMSSREGGAVLSTDTLVDVRMNWYYSSLGWGALECSFRRSDIFISFINSYLVIYLRLTECTQTCISRMHSFYIQFKIQQQEYVFLNMCDFFLSILIWHNNELMKNQIKSQSSLAHIKSKIKVVFLGDQSTGKTSILLRFMHDKFEQGQGATVGIDFMAKNITVNSTHLRLQLWDTAGQERFRSLIPSYLKDATVTFIVFDLTNRRSFENVKEWIQLCHQSRREKNIMVLLGNKVDLEDDREVTKQQAQQMAKNELVNYFQISAKTNENIRQIFTHVAQEYVQQTYANDETIGNIENLHSNYVNQMAQGAYGTPTKNQPSQRESKKIIELNAQAITNKPQKNKKGCC